LFWAFRVTTDEATVEKVVAQYTPGMRVTPERSPLPIRKSHLALEAVWYAMTRVAAHDFALAVLICTGPSLMT
jgi:hypothetical protein